MLNNVICIRCSRTVTKFEKLWISKGIAIEDPFDLSHNLGSALTRKMSLYIIKALRKGRNHFARPVKIQMRDSKTIEAYFMNVRELTDGEPPNDRGCRVCKSIGHKERECPQKRKKKGKKGAKSLNKPRNDESPSKKAPISEDEDFSDSDNESSDQEDNTSQRETPKKVVNQPQFKQNRDNNGNSNRAKQSKPPPNNKARPNSGFKQKPEPASKIQDQNGSSGSQSSFSTHPKTPISIPRTPNPQVAPMNSNGSASPNTSNSDLANTVKQNSVNTAHIPTRIFSNSSLNPDLIPATVNSVSFPIPRFQILPETVRGGIPPPPGFNPLVQPQPFSGLPFRIAAPNQQSPWVADSIPRPYVQMVRPRPPMGLPQVPGMLGPTEQRIWGHSTSDPPTFAPMPRQPFAPRYFDRESADMKHTLGLEAELSDLQINAKVCAGYPHNL
ncbi:terminal uridylyltransferase 4-like [Macrosteles quadrilineatus]|uniref:terminal uridylyltransferase 4-like n=1 Tax=Macrosteles quadrilineatus TaxID=74068 RepID=UPI0023E2257F|nr:terminal uridylyltransferase 4-like [Macrosteles quadrilineatus]